MPGMDRKAVTLRERWLRIDARPTVGEVAPTTRLAGVPLVARHVRLAARLAFRGAVVVVETPARAAVERVLAAYPAPAGFAVEVVGSPVDDDRPFVAVRAAELHSREVLAAAQAGESPPPVIRLGGAAQLSAAEDRLFGDVKKSLDADGIVSYFFMRPLARVATRILVGTRVSPNQVTLAAMAFGLAASFVVARGVALAPAAAALLWLGAAIDHIDGDLARLRLESSRLGEWLDTTADDVSTFSFLAGLGVGIHGDGGGELWLLLGVGGALVGVLCAVTQYRDLYRLGLPIDTARYPWFFGTPAESDAPRRGVLSLTFYATTFLFRRDVFITVIALTAAFGALRAAASLLAVGVAVLAVLLVVHKLVEAFTPGRTPAGTS